MLDAVLSGVEKWQQIFNEIRYFGAVADLGYSVAGQGFTQLLEACRGLVKALRCVAVIMGRTRRQRVTAWNGGGEVSVMLGTAAQRDSHT